MLDIDQPMVIKSLLWKSWAWTEEKKTERQVKRITSPLKYKTVLDVIIRCCKVIRNYAKESSFGWNTALKILRLMTWWKTWINDFEIINIIRIIILQRRIILFSHIFIQRRIFMATYLWLIWSTTKRNGSWFLILLDLLLKRSIMKMLILRTQRKF